MNVFLDENLNVGLCRVLSQVTPFHNFKHANDLGFRAVEDTDLFGLVANRGFDLMITDDRRQLKVGAELQALRDSGLHWATMRKSNIGGLAGLSADAATLVACLPHFSEIISDSHRPQRIRILGVQRERRQRLKHEDL